MTCHSSCNRQSFHMLMISGQSIGWHPSNGDSCHLFSVAPPAHLPPSKMSRAAANRLIGALQSSARGRLAGVGASSPLRPLAAVAPCRAPPLRAASTLPDAPALPLSSAHREAAKAASRKKMGDGIVGSSSGTQRAEVTLRRFWKTVGIMQQPDGELGGAKGGMGVTERARAQGRRVTWGHVTRRQGQLAVSAPRACTTGPKQRRPTGFAPPPFARD